MHKTLRKFNGKTFMLDELSYFGISKSDAEKRKAIGKKSGFGARLVKKANGKYVVYREYHGDQKEVDTLHYFLRDDTIAIKNMVQRIHESLLSDY
jgi:hypothetical protein